MADKLGTKVTPIRNKGGKTLVEWTYAQRLHRSWIPSDAVQQDGEEYRVERPSAGIPYGHNFAKLLTISATPDAIDAELKRRGIWTIEDLRARPNSALGALQSVYGVDMAALFQAADMYEAEEKRAAARERASEAKEEGSGE